MSIPCDHPIRHDGHEQQRGRNVVALTPNPHTLTENPQDPRFVGFSARRHKATFPASMVPQPRSTTADVSPAKASANYYECERPPSMYFRAFLPARRPELMAKAEDRPEATLMQ